MLSPSGYRSNLQFYREKEGELGNKHRCVANLDATAQRGPRTNEWGLPPPKAAASGSCL